MVVTILLSRLFFFAPVITLLLLERGLDYPMIFLFGALASLSAALFEVPTGIIADRLGNKKMIIGSNLSWVAFGFTLLVAKDFWQFAVAAMLEGAATAMFSGAGDALIYGTLIESGRESQAKKVFGRLKASSMVALLVAPPIGSILATRFGYTSTVNLTLVTAVLGLVASIFLVEPNRGSVAKSLTFTQTAKTLRGFVQNRSLLIIALNYSLVTVTASVITFLNQPYFLASGIPVEYFGAIMSVSLVGAILASLLADRVERVIGVGSAVLLSALLPGAAFLLMSQSNLAAVAILGVIVIMFFRQMREPLFSDYINRLVSSSERATMLSVVSMVTGITGTIIKPAVGYAAGVNLSAALMLSALILIATPLLLRVNAKTIAIKETIVTDQQNQSSQVS